MPKPPPSDPDPALRAVELSTRLYGELRDLAVQRLRRATPGQSLPPTALVHEAWLKLRGDGTFADRSQFFGAAARAMKDVLVDRLRARLAQKRGGGQHPVELDTAVPDLAPGLPVADLLSLDEALAELQRDHPEEAEVVLRRFFAGQTNAELAADLGIGESTVERRWRFARAWLASRLGSDFERSDP
ncbi:MAG: RNA polymerase subunit sigma [Planctomycetes bacterium]|nr:RNA polymerase subunit sigma [Planctomycetota bacterium]